MLKQISLALILILESKSTFAVDVFKSSFEIGILEERCTSESAKESVDEGFQTGVRAVFYWADNRWHSYQPLFVTGSANDWKNTSSEFARRRQWHFKHGGEDGTLTSEATVELPLSLRFAVQPIVEGRDTVPQTSRSRAYVWWNGVPVRPPVAVSTQRNIPMSQSLPDGKIVKRESISDAVLRAGYEYLRKELGSSWPCDAPHEDCAGYNAEVESVFDSATRYAIDREAMVIYDFHEVEEPDYQPMSIAPMICEDAESGELWHLRDGLKFIAAGDFNLDGEWEFIFWIDAYNENGYLVASSNFRSVASYTWNYH